MLEAKIKVDDTDKKGRRAYLSFSDGTRTVDSYDVQSLVHEIVSAKRASRISVDTGLKLFEELRMNNNLGLAERRRW